MLRDETGFQVCVEQGIIQSYIYIHQLRVQRELVRNMGLFLTRIASFLNKKDAILMMLLNSKCLEIVKDCMHDNEKLEGLIFNIRIVLIKIQTS